MFLRTPMPPLKLFSILKVGLTLEWQKSLPKFKFCLQVLILSTMYKIHKIWMRKTVQKCKVRKRIWAGRPDGKTDIQG